MTKIPATFPFQGNGFRMLTPDIAHLAPTGGSGDFGISAARIASLMTQMGVSAQPVLLAGGRAALFLDQPHVEQPGEIRRMCLRPYQEEGADSSLRAMSLRKHGGIIVLPTGTGKTATFTEIAKRAQELGLLDDLFGNKQILCLVHRVELVDQAQKAFGRVFGSENVSVASEGRKSRDLTGRVVIAGVQTLTTDGMLAQLDPGKFGLVIVDETHHIVAETWQKILRHLGLVDEQGHGTKAEGKFLLGVTATPDRTDGEHISKVFPDGILFSKPLLWFILKKYLLKPQGTLVYTSAKLSDIKVGVDGDYNEDQLGKAMSESPVLQDTVRAYDQAASGKRALVFASSVPHAHRLAEEFNKGCSPERPRAMAIDGKMDPEERRRIIDAHKRGEFDILINYGILTEGYDDPGIQVIINCRPTRSRSFYVQMIGRGMRPDSDHPELDSVLIIDIAGSAQDHELDMDLCRLFGIEYVEAGLPPTDIVEALEEILDKEKKGKRKGAGTDGDTNGEGEDQDADREMIFREIAMLRAQAYPLSGLLFKVMHEKYEGDITRMAWDLTMAEDNLSNYIAGIFPEKENEVRKDFRNAMSVLGISPDRVVELWRQSQSTQVVTRLMEAVRKVRADSQEVTLHQFIGKVCEVAGVDPRTFPFRLWHADRREHGQSRETVAAIEEILELYPTSGNISRATVKRDIEALTALAKEPGIFGHNLMQKAFERGVMLTSHSEPEFRKQFGMSSQQSLLKKFWKVCEEGFLYSGELRRILYHNTSRSLTAANLEKILGEFFAIPAGDRPKLQHWLIDRTACPRQNPLSPILAFLFSPGSENAALKKQILEAVYDAGVFKSPVRSFSDILKEDPEQFVLKTVDWSIYVPCKGPLPPELRDYCVQLLLEKNWLVSIFSKEIDSIIVMGGLSIVFEDKDFSIDEGMAEMSRKLQVDISDLDRWDRYMGGYIRTRIGNKIETLRRFRNGMKDSSQTTTLSPRQWENSPPSEISEEEARIVRKGQFEKLLRRGLIPESLSLGRGSHGLPPAAVIPWEICPDVNCNDLRKWGRYLYGSLEKAEDMVRGLIRERAVTVFEAVKGELRSAGRATSGNFYQRVMEVTGLGRAQVREWEGHLALFETGYKACDFPLHVPEDISGPPTSVSIGSSDGRALEETLSIIQAVRQKRWTSLDGPRDKQRKIREAFEERGVNLDDDVIRIATPWWDWDRKQLASGGTITQRSIALLLFAEKEARFPPWKQKGSKRRK